MTTNPKRQSFAAAANIIAVLCAGISLVTLTIAYSQIFNRHLPSINAFAVMVCTLPVTIVCTIIALVLVGPRRSKLALIGIGIFALQFILAYTADMILMHIHQ